jgi:hypothetical protein
MGLIETLFTRRVMAMGPSRHDPSRCVGTFNREVVSKLPALRAAELVKFSWIAGEWSYENAVPETPMSPPYIDAGFATFALCENGTWICGGAQGAPLRRQITFDPFSGQWMFVLAEGSYGILRSPGWIGSQIAFTGLMTMIGVECEWRMTWSRAGDNEFGFVNEERLPDGSWSYIDEWRYRRL